MSLWNKIFSGGASEIIKGADSLIDNVSTSDEEKLKVKRKLSEIVYSGLNNIAGMYANIMTTEMQGNWLQRSWRPITMLSFTLIIFYRYFIAPVFGLPAIEIPDVMWELLKLAFGVYLFGRSAEKIGGSVLKNSDLSMLKKRDRAENFEK